MPKWIKFSWWWLLIPACLYLGPFLFFPAFNIIDDGASLFVAQRLNAEWSVQNWAPLLIETQVGRFRPLYHLSFFMAYLLFGVRPWFFWAMQAFLLGFTLVGMSRLIFLATKQRWLSFLSPLALLVFPPVAENFYRLGTAEPRQMVVFVWLLVVLAEVKEQGWTWRRIVLSLLFFIILLFLKETSIFFVSAFLLLALWKWVIAKKTSFIDWVVLVVCGAASLVFLTFLPQAGSYSSGFHLNPHEMYGRLLAARLSYSALFFPLTIAIFATGFRFVSEWFFTRTVKLTEYFYALFLGSQIGVILVGGILPWQFQLPRYYYPLYIVGILYMVTELSYWLKPQQIISRFAQRWPWAWHIGVAVAAIFIQLFVFQSGAGGRPSLSLTFPRLTTFNSQYSAVFLLLGAGIGLAGLQWLLRREVHAKLHPSQLVAMKDRFGVAVLALVAAFFSGGFWGGSTQRTMYAFLFLSGWYVSLELLSWQQAMKEPWFPRVKRGPLLAYGLSVALAVVMPLSWKFPRDTFSLKPFLGGVADNLSMAFDTHQVSYALIANLLAQTPEQAHLYVSSADYEIIFEIGLYASRLKQRPIFLYTNNQPLIDDLGSEYSYLHYTADPITDFAHSNQSPRMLLLRKQTWESLLQEATAAATLSASELEHRGKKEVIHWDEYHATKLMPRATLFTIPESAYWIKVIP